MRWKALPWPALAVWIAATATLFITVGVAGYGPFDSRTWTRTDSGLYLLIARHGYDLLPCAPPYAAGTWCGNAGWFLGYPWLIALLHATGLPAAGTAVVISWLFDLGTIVLLWTTFLERSHSVAALAVLTYAAFAPGQIYDYAIYPLSMLAFFTVLCLWMLHRSRWLGAGLAGAAAAITYPLGLLLAPVAAIWLLVDGAAPLRERLRRTAIAAGTIIAGGGLVLAAIWTETGRWNAYFLVQGKYKHGLQEPFQTLVDAWDALARGPLLRIENAPALQTLLVALVLACVLAEIALRRRRLERLDLLLVLWALATWVVPSAETHLSLHRSQAALLPLAVLLIRLARPLLLTLVACAVLLTVPMALLYVRGQLW